MIDSRRDSVFLMANLGSEVARLCSAKEAGDSERVAGARQRADMILSQLRARPDMESRKAELDILTEIIDDYVAPVQRLSVHAESLAEYFQPFALRALSAHVSMIEIKI